MLLNIIRRIYRRKVKKFNRATKGIISERERVILIRELEREAYQNTLVTTISVVHILSRVTDVMIGIGIAAFLVLSGGVQNMDGTVNVSAGLIGILSMVLVAILTNIIKPYLKKQENQIKRWIVD